MNRSPLHAGNSRLWKPLLTGRDDISWAGASEGDRGFCFGTEEGAVFWTNFDGVQYGKPLEDATLEDDDEAINGVAFNAGQMVVTTRSGSASWRYPEGKESKRKVGRIGEGSHGVIAGRNGVFFMPLNVGGLMSIWETPPNHYSSLVSKPQAMDLNVYRVASLISSEGQDVVAIAARYGGVAVGLYKPGETMGLAALEIPGADFIDICPAGRLDFPTAAYALTRDSRILAFDDVVTDREPGAVRYEGVAGVAYRILAAGNFVFVLTSTALHVVHNFVEATPDCFRVNHRTPSTSYGLDAIDMNLVGQRWLLVLLADRVLRLDLLELEKELSSAFVVRVAEPLDVWANAVVKVRQLDSRMSEFALVK